MLFDTKTDERYPYHLEMQNIRGKSIVIVGDISGAGRATALMLAELGAKVFVAARSSEELNLFFDEVARSGGRADGVTVDLCRPESVRRFYEQAERRMGQLDVVINYLADGSVLPVDPEACQNLSMQHAITHMQDKGHIINVGSKTPERASLIPVTGKVSARGVAAELRRQANEAGIRVTLISPGAVSSRRPAYNEQVISPEDVARCVYSTLIDPSVGDLIFLHGQFPSQAL